MAAKPERLVFQSYRSSHINDETHHLQLYGISSGSKILDSYTRHLSLSRFRLSCFSSRTTLNTPFLLTSQRPPKFLGNIWSRSLPLVDRWHPHETITFHTSFLALSPGFWRSCNSAVIISIKTALKELNLVFHPGRCPFFTETAYKLW